MKARGLLNAALALAVAVLAWLAWNKPAPEPKGQPVSTVQPAAVKAIRVESPRGTVELAREADHWKLLQPWTGRADSLQAAAALEVAAARASRKLPANDLKAYELDKPTLTVTLDGTPFAFGMENPVSGEQYLHAGDAVWLVSAHLAGRLNLPAAAFAARSPLAEGEQPVGFRLGAVTLSRKDGKWAANPSRDGLSADTLNRYAEEWRLASAVEVAPLPRDPGGEALTVSLADGREITYRILAREPSLTLGRLDEKLSYRFARGAGERLLTPFDPKP